MHILMTGGTGMIGVPLTQNLLDDGHAVTILTRNPDSKSGVPAGANLMWWDAKTTEGWGHVVNESDVIVHLAGESLAEGRWTDERKKRIRDSRVLTGQALVAAVEEAATKPKAFIQASGVGYYGPRKDEVVDANAGPGSDFTARICFEWESATAPVERLGLRRAVARSAIVLSTEGGALPRIVLPFKMFAGGKIGSGNQWWSWIHIDDEVRALRFLIDQENAKGPFNLSTPNPVKNKDFASTVGSVMGRPSALPVPSLALSTLFGEMSAVLLEGQAVLPTRLLELGFEFRFPELEDALRDLLK